MMYWLFLLRRAWDIKDDPPPFFADSPDDGGGADLFASRQRRRDFDCCGVATASDPKHRSEP